MVEKTKKEAPKAAPPAAAPPRKVEAEKKTEVKDLTLEQYAEETADSHKGIVFSETAGGKTRFYMRILDYLKSKGVKPDQVLMYILNTDRATGVTSFINSVPREFLKCVHVLQVVDYDTLINATEQADVALMKHVEKQGYKYAFLIHELLGEPWTYAQDHYVRKSYNEGLGDYFATKKGLEKAIRDDVSAYKALDGWKDWSVIKLLHNSAWMDKLKNKPYNVWFTAELKPGEEGSIFAKSGRPAGEKLDIHRVNEIVKLSREGDDYFMEPIKLTGYTKRYPKQKVTGKNAYAIHEEKLTWLESIGCRESVIKKLEQEAGITPPEKPPEEETPPQEPENTEEPPAETPPEPEAAPEAPVELPKEPKQTGEELVRLDGDKVVFNKLYDDGSKKGFKRVATEADKAHFKKPAPAVAKPAPPKPKTSTPPPAAPKKEEKKEEPAESGGSTLEW